MTHNTQGLDELISNLSGESFDAAVNNPDDYMAVLTAAEAKARQAFLQWVSDEVIGKDRKHRDSVFAREFETTPLIYENDLKKYQRNILKQHGFKESE